MGILVVSGDLPEALLGQRKEGTELQRQQQICALESCCLRYLIVRDIPLTVL
jgi:hypothetical protein